MFFLIPPALSLIAWIGGDMLSYHFTGNDMMGNLYGLITTGKLPSPMVPIDDIELVLVPNWIDGMTFWDFIEHMWLILLIMFIVGVISFRIANPRRVRK